MQLMVLIVAGAVVLILGHAWFTGRKLRKVEFRLLGLVPAAAVPQLLAFYIPATRVWVPDLMAPVILVWSQLVLLGFVVVNWRRPGMWLLGSGLTMNLVAILANGGMMPVSPHTASRLSAIEGWEAGVRFGAGKSVVLPTQATIFGSLSDRIMLPDWLPYQAAYSLGDILIVAGAIVLLWAMTHGAKKESQAIAQGSVGAEAQEALVRSVPDFGPQQIGG